MFTQLHNEPKYQISLTYLSLLSHDNVVLNQSSGVLSKVMFFTNYQKL